MNLTQLTGLSLRIQALILFIVQWTKSVLVWGFFSWRITILSHSHTWLLEIPARVHKPVVSEPRFHYDWEIFCECTTLHLLPWVANGANTGYSWHWHRAWATWDLPWALKVETVLGRRTGPGKGKPLLWPTDTNQYIRGAMNPVSVSIQTCRGSSLQACLLSWCVALLRTTLCLWSSVNRSQLPLN